MKEKRPDKDSKKSGLPDDIVRGIKDKILDIYPDLKKEFGKMDRKKFIRLAAGVEKMMKEYPRELRFLDYLLLDRIILWRTIIRQGAMEDREVDATRGREQALRKWALGFPGKIVLKAEEMRTAMEEERKRELNQQGPRGKGGPRKAKK